ncbi:MAG: lycopene cyclase domain-containing protein [Myxococcota bacterium]
MRAEYLIFNLVVMVPPLLLSLRRDSGMAGRRGDAARAIVWMALPFLVWDAWAAGRHWTFNESYVLGPALAGLPFEEILFFASVPFACLFLWQSVFRKLPERRSPGLAWLYRLPWLLTPLGAVLFALGRQYTGLTLLALAAVCVWDHRSGTRLLLQPRFHGFLAAVLGLTAIFNGYLTARPVVLYGAQYQLDFLLGTIPIEDFGYGLALVFGVAVGFEGARQRSLLARGVERLFGGYRHRIDTADDAAPVATAEPRRIAVVGAGIAGLTAAATLAERGHAVVLYEANDYLGGKIGAWPELHPDGSTRIVEHGFHAFFRHYYNLEAFLERVGAAQHLVPIDEYLIVARDGARTGFAGISSIPFVNLLSMAAHRVYRIRDIALGPAGEEMAAFFRYDAERTFAEFDDVSFEAFAERAQLPARLRLVFSTFARAFFADADRLSMAELIKSFHSYYLSHDHGLLYRYPDGDYQETLLGPIRRHLEKHGVQIQLGRAIEALGREGDGFRVAGEPCDAVVLAAPAAASRAILEHSPFVAEEDPTLHAKLPHLRCGQRSAMLRLWLDRDLDEALPIFVTTEKIRALDSVTSYHRVSRQSADWAREHGGGIFELHCYAVPDELGSDAEVREALVSELPHSFPELAPAKILNELLQVRDDFAAFHRNMAATRPEVETAIPGLVLAGDWVKLPCPAMLMEAACTSGLLAANALLRRDGLREAPVASVPLRGLLAPRGSQSRARERLGDPGRVE